MHLKVEFNMYQTKLEAILFFFKEDQYIWEDLVAMVS
jgi:hypothetical protein